VISDIRASPYAGEGAIPSDLDLYFEAMLQAVPPSYGMQRVTMY